MLKFIASMSLAAFLSLSPVLAAERGTPPKVVGCMSPEALLQTVPPQFKFISWLEGDKIARLAKLVGDDLPAGTDLILVFATESLRRENLFMIQLFNKGCISGQGVITAHAMDVANSKAEPETTPAPEKKAPEPKGDDDNKISAPPFMSHPSSRQGPSGWDGKI